MLVLLVAATLGLSPRDADWPSYRHDLDNSGHFDSIPSIRLHLRAAWTYHADSFVTSTPVEESGFVYVGTWNGDVVALDAASGSVRWKAHLSANSDEVYGGPRGVVGSVAVDGGMAYAASGGCTLAALDARTGRERWRRTICDTARNDDVYASPVVAGGVVIVGICMLDDRPTDRGRELAFDIKTGQLRWLMEPALYKGSGVGMSASPAVDLAQRRVYVGTGNPTPSTHPPSGDDLGSESILAVDLARGTTLWSFGPVHPHDVNDDDFLASPNRFNAATRLHPTWAIGEGNKDGTYYVVRADSGKTLWRRALAPSDPSATILGTAAAGEGAVYVPLLNGSIGSLTALRASDGAVLWQRSTGPEWEAPVLWGPDVFTTESTGWLDAFRAGTGAPLGRWRLCGRATGRGPSVARGALFVAAGKCVTRFVASST